MRPTIGRNVEAKVSAEGLNWERLKMELVQTLHLARTIIRCRFHSGGQAYDWKLIACIISRFMVLELVGM